MEYLNLSKVTLEEIKSVNGSRLRILARNILIQEGIPPADAISLISQERLYSAAESWMSKNLCGDDIQIHATNRPNGILFWKMYFGEYLFCDSDSLYGLLLKYYLISRLNLCDFAKQIKK